MCSHKGEIRIEDKENKDYNNKNTSPFPYFRPQNAIFLSFFTPNFFFFSFGLSFPKQNPNRPLLFFENCYCSLNLLFFVLPIIFITIKRKGNHMFFKPTRKRNQECSPCLS